jgi:hypothetical protein
MSQVELYQSVLMKLGQLPASELVKLNNYLALLTSKHKTTSETISIAHLSGAWKAWDDRDFEEFLQIVGQIRHDLFVPRTMEL